MTQSTILAAGVTAATSTDVTVAAGAVVVVGLFAATADTLAPPVAFSVFQDTPGADNVIALLNNNIRTLSLTGPGTFRVGRPAYTGVAFGVFLEA